MTTEQKQDLVRKTLTLNVNLTDEEYGKYIEKLRDALYYYLEFAHYLRQGNSELGNINRTLAAFARGELTVEETLRSL